MKKRNKLLFGALAAGGLAAAYALTRRKDTVSIVLKEKLTEGYAWHYEIETSGIISEYGSDYIPSFDDGESGDSYGQHKWTFAPVSRGETLVRFVCVRPWESDDPPCASAVYRFTVNEYRKITVELLERSQHFNEYTISVK